MLSSCRDSEKRVRAELLSEPGTVGTVKKKKKKKVPWFMFASEVDDTNVRWWRTSNCFKTCDTPSDFKHIMVG